VGAGKKPNKELCEQEQEFGETKKIRRGDTVSSGLSTFEIASSNLGG
jgi:hypothetical protein